MKIYKRNNKDALFDPVRKKLIIKTPEELVRQTLILNLINAGFPIDNILIEYNINNICCDTMKRADIVITRGNGDQQNPFFLIEVKAPEVTITDEVLEQALRYNEYLNCEYVAITNSPRLTDLFIYYIDKRKNKPLLLKGFYNLKELIDMKNLKYEEIDKMERFTYEENTSPQIIDYLKHDAHVIGLDTPSDLHHIISELYDCILNEKIDNIPFTYFDYNFLEDIGCSYRSYTNAGGGRFNNFYRSFIISDLNKENQIYRISINQIAKLNNDPKFGNQRGTTSIFVTVDDFERKPHSTLELCIDKSFDKKDNRFQIFHDGSMTAYRGAVKKQVVINYVSQICPELECVLKVKVAQKTSLI